MSLNSLMKPAIIGAAAVFAGRKFGPTNAFLSVKEGANPGFNMPMIAPKGGLTAAVILIPAAIAYYLSK